ncbi:MAG TPA: DinB family protein [Tepidisphaeraceae bacterium]|nr:DinB family protein [Tepidisphaeraceae bacterium]
MTDYLKQILLNQYEASLCMLRETLEACPHAAWNDKIAVRTLGQTAYHTLFFTDYYLSPTERDFQYRPLHAIGGDELADGINPPGLPQPAALTYLHEIRTKARDILAAETDQSLQAPAAFAYRKFSRGELHIYNVRHVQHHTAQFQAHLRRTIPTMQSDDVLQWRGSGWRE